MLLNLMRQKDNITCSLESFKFADLRRITQVKRSKGAQLQDPEMKRIYKGSKLALRKRHLEKAFTLSLQTTMSVIVPLPTTSIQVT